MVTIVGIGFAITSFDLTPRFKERIPTAKFSVDGDSMNLTSLLWSMENDEDLTEEACLSSYPLSVDMSDFLANITDYLYCDNDEQTTHFINNDLDYELDFVNITQKLNGSFCYSETTDYEQDHNMSADITSCVIVNHPDLPKYMKGTHKKTFWIYIALRLFFQISVGSTYSIIDGTALWLAKDQQSEYSIIITIPQAISGLLSPLVAGLVIRDPKTDAGNSIGEFDRIGVNGLVVFRGNGLSAHVLHSGRLPGGFLDIIGLHEDQD